MTALLIDRRAFVTAALAATVAGCATSIPARRGGAIPFLTATAAKAGDGEDYQIAWDAPGVDGVAIYGGSSPSPILKGKPLVSGRGTGLRTIMLPLPRPRTKGLPFRMGEGVDPP